MAEIQVKHCGACGQTKPVTEFYPLKKSGGFHSECKACSRARYNAWRKANREKHANRNNGWYYDNRGTALARCKAYRNSLGDELKNRKREEYVKHVGRYRKSAAAWRIANPEKRRLSHLRREARKRSLPHRWTLADMKAALAHWSGKCPVCQCELDQIQWDHWIPLICPTCPGTVAENMLPLCPTCNLRKNDSMPVSWLKRMFPTTWEQIRNRVEMYLTQCKPSATSTTASPSSSPP